MNRIVLPVDMTLSPRSRISLWLLLTKWVSIGSNSSCMLSRDRGLRVVVGDKKDGIVGRWEDNRSKE